MEDGVALDNDVRKEVATDTTSGGVGTLHTPVLETPAANPRAGMRPTFMNGGGGKEGNRKQERDRNRPDRKANRKKNGAGAG